MMLIIVGFIKKSFVNAVRQTVHNTVCCPAGQPQLKVAAKIKNTLKP